MRRGGPRSVEMTFHIRLAFLHNSGLLSHLPRRIEAERVAAAVAAAEAAIPPPLPAEDPTRARRRRTALATAAGEAATSGGGAALRTGEVRRGDVCHTRIASSFLNNEE